MNKSNTKKTTKSVRETQQKDKEARDLLKDLDSLVTLKHEKKLRWIWELVQNAVDCSEGNKVNISINLSFDRITFTHDGAVFKLEDLVALVTKGSTKSSEGLEGKKGKFGTGFVSTHVLNKLVTISGFLTNETGIRKFSLDIDRSMDSLDVLTSTLDSTFEKIDEINEKPSEQHEYVFTTFEYKLESGKMSVAKGGLEELERDLPFTLLVNKDQLHSVKITDENGTIKSFIIEEPVEVCSGLDFLKIVTDTNQPSGLLFSKSDLLTIAFPAVETENGYSLIRISNQARIFRNFPLIGTENFHSPCFLHSELFQPSEQRDGIRTLKDDELKSDKFADDNRRVLCQYPTLFNNTFTKFVDKAVDNFYLLAESGIPENSQNYLATDWFISTVQKPIRDFLLQHKLVSTVDGSKVKIAEARFLKEFEIDKELYEIVSELYPSNIPNKGSYDAWKIIIDQNPETWPNGIFIDLDCIVEDVKSKGTLDNLKLLNDSSIEWLNKLIKYLLKNNRVDLIEKYSIYPNQAKMFKKRADLRIDPGFKEEFKDISKKIYRDLQDVFVLTDLKYQEEIKVFEIGDYFNGLNDFLGKFEVSKATEEQYLAIFKLCCHFKNNLSPNRNEWFEIEHSLVPDYAKSKIIATELNDYNFDSVDKWTLKYISWLVQNSITLKHFSEVYFATNIELAYDWLNRFINYACMNEANREIALKYSIIPTQDGNFRRYENNNLFRENNPIDFEDLFKDLAKEFTKRDPKSYLVDTRIKNEQLAEEDAYYLTGQIDKIFNESNIEYEVEEGKKFSMLFHKVNEWYSREEDLDKKGQVKQEDNKQKKYERLFPIFKGKRADLSVRAFGKDVSKIIAEKGITEMKALSTLKLPSEVLSQLENAAYIAGGHQVLLDKANEIFELAEAIRWRQQVGAAAENAFVEAMGEIETKFDLENPDIGKDFTIKSKETGKEFYIEIKSTVIGAETVKMSALQGETASQEKERYALCVITRPAGSIIDKEYFLQNAKFVINIGDLIGDKLTEMKSGLGNLTQYENGEVNVTMDNKTYAVYVSKKIWENGNDFSSFIERIKDNFRKASI